MNSVPVNGTPTPDKQNPASDYISIKQHNLEISKYKQQLQSAHEKLAEESQAQSKVKDLQAEVATLRQEKEGNQLFLSSVVDVQKEVYILTFLFRQLFKRV